LAAELEAAEQVVMRWGSASPPRLLFPIPSNETIGPQAAVAAAGGPRY